MKCDADNLYDIHTITESKEHEDTEPYIHFYPYLSVLCVPKDYDVSTLNSMEDYTKTGEDFAFSIQP